MIQNGYIMKIQLLRIHVKAIVGITLIVLVVVNLLMIIWLLVACIYL